MKIKLKNTKLVDEYKRPILFFHTSPVGDIKRFYPLSHFGTKKSAEMRAMHYVYQALGIPEPEFLPDVLPENIRKRFSKLKGAPQLFTYPVHLYSKSILKTPDLTKHNLEQFYRWFTRQYAPKSRFLTSAERLEGDGVGETKTTYKKALAEFIFVDPFLQSKEDLEKELAADTLYSSVIKKETPESFPSFLISAKENLKKIPFDLAEKVAFGRMIRFLEGEGYDTLSYKNTHEDINQTTYIVLRPEQVFKQNAFDEEHVIQPNDALLLAQIEKNFFRKKQILSPSERIDQVLCLKKQKIR